MKKPVQARTARPEPVEHMVFRSTPTALGLSNSGLQWLQRSIPMIEATDRWRVSSVLAERIQRPTPTDSGVSADASIIDARTNCFATPLSSPVPLSVAYAPG